MKTLKTTLAASAIIALMSGAAFAASTDAVQKPVASNSKTEKQAKLHSGIKLFTAKSEKGKECSAQADAQNLHGTARRHFRHACMKVAPKSAQINPAVAPKAGKAAPAIVH